jgi:hypothetical protein
MRVTARGRDIVLEKAEKIVDLSGIASREGHRATSDAQHAGPARGRLGTARSPALAVPGS